MAWSFGAVCTAPVGDVDIYQVDASGARLGPTTDCDGGSIGFEVPGDTTRWFEVTGQSSDALEYEVQFSVT